MQALLVKKFARPAMATATGARFRFLTTRQSVSELDRCFFCFDDDDDPRLTTNSFSEAFMNRIPRAKREWSRRLSLTTDPKLAPTWIRPTRTRESAECLMVDIYLSIEAQKNMRTYVLNRTVFVKARSDRRERTYVCWFDLPDIDSTTKIYNTSDIKTVFNVQKGWLELIIPKVKKQEITVYRPDGRTFITRECDCCFDSRLRRLTTKTFYEAFMNPFLRAKRT